MFLILFSTYNNVFQHPIKSRCLLHSGQIQRNSLQMLHLLSQTQTLLLHPGQIHRSSLQVLHLLSQTQMRLIHPGQLHRKPPDAPSPVTETDASTTPRTAPQKPSRCSISCHRHRRFHYTQDSSTEAASRCSISCHRHRRV